MLFIYFYVNYEIWTELLTPDRNAILAFIYGCLGGVLGTFLRNRAISDSKPDSTKEGFGHYCGWAAFGSLVALTISGVPFAFFISLIIGIFAPSAYKLMEKKIPDFVSNLGGGAVKKNGKES